MVPINGRPFLEYQIELLSSRGPRNVVLCVGHLGEQVESHFGDGSRFGVQLSYSWDGDQLQGTGGALKKAEPLLKDDFLVMYGDSYLQLDYQEVLSAFRVSAMPGLMVVYRNCDKYDRSNVTVRDGLVAVYDKMGATTGHKYIDYGLSAFRKETLKMITEDVVYDLGRLFQTLVERELLKAWEARRRFYEVGSSAGLAEFRELIASSQHKREKGLV